MPFRYLEIQPNSTPASGKISHARGFPNITMTIGRQNAVLDMASIRVCGKLNIWTDAAGTLHPVDAGTATNLTASAKLGIYGVMDQVVFRHAETKQVAEHVRHYSRFMSSYLPVMSSKQDSMGHMSESALITNNHASFKSSVIQNAGESSFCVPIPCGMTLGGNKVPLNSLPLDLEISLAPDSAFFYSESATGSLADLQDCFYELTDVRLMCEIYEPEANEMASMLPTSGAFSFNSITSYFTTLESTNSIVNFRLGLSKVLAAFVNFIPSSFVNNLAQDGSLTYMPAVAPSGANDVAGGALANLSQISFLKNGQRFPAAFETETNYDLDRATPSVDPQVIKSFMSSIVPETHHVRSNICPQNSNRVYAINNNLTDGYKVMPFGGAMWGVGVVYDMLDSDGVDFSTEQFSIQMRNDLTDGNPNSADLFVKSKNTIAWKDGMIQVVS